MIVVHSETKCVKQVCILSKSCNKHETVRNCILCFGLLHVTFLCIGADEEETITKKPNSLAYQCSQCNRTLYLTPTEILKHKKQHQ
jgi:hypothetical protein